MEDFDTIEALLRVDRLRDELRAAEAHLKTEIAAFSKRRSYGWALREYNVRSLLESEMKQYHAA